MTDLRLLNRRLGRILSVTTVGDYLSYFGSLLILYRATGDNALWAAQLLIVKSAATSIGGLTLSHVMTAFSNRTILAGTQVLSGAVSAVTLAYWVTAPSPTPIVFFVLGFLTTLLKQYYDTANESYSSDLGRALAKSPTENANARQRGLVADLLAGTYNAQVIGPLLAIVLLVVLPAALKAFDLRGPIEASTTYIALALDALSFIVAGVLLIGIPNFGTPKVVRLRGALATLRSDRRLRLLTLLRGVGFWIPAGIFNFLAFSVITEHYGDSIVTTALLYSAAGVGLVVASVALGARSALLSPFLSRIQAHLKRTPDARVTAFALIALGVSRIPFILSPSLGVAIVFIAISGAFTGLQGIASRSLRRDFCSNSGILEEIISLEIVVGKAVDAGIAYLCKLLIAAQIVSVEAGVWASFASYALLGLVYFSPVFEPKPLPADKAATSPQKVT